MIYIDINLDWIVAMGMQLVTTGTFVVIDWLTALSMSDLLIC